MEKEKDNMTKLTKQQIAEVKKQIEFKKQSLIEWLNNTAKWDKWNGRQVPLAEAKEEIVQAIIKEFDMAVPWDESGEKKYKQERDRLVEWIDITFIRGRSRYPIQEVVKRVEDAMTWLYPK